MKKNISPVIKCNHVAGFTLIEVLVSMLILAVGLLGIASLQFRGLAYGTDAAIRSNMIVLAYDMAERIRLNRANAAAYRDPPSDPANPDSAPAAHIVPATRPGNCTQETAADAQNDRNCWYRSFWINANASYIPPGTTVSIEEEQPANSGMYRITFRWADRTRPGAPQRIIIYPFRP